MMKGLSGATIWSEGLGNLLGSMPPSRASSSRLPFTPA